MQYHYEKVIPYTLTFLYHQNLEHFVTSFVQTFSAPENFGAPLHHALRTDFGSAAPAIAPAVGAITRSVAPLRSAAPKVCLFHVEYRKLESRVKRRSAKPPVNVIYTNSMVEKRVQNNV